MNRTLHILNLIGVLLLAVLCIVQWQANRRLNLRTIALREQRDQQAAKIAQQQTTLQGATADLNDFRARLVAADNALKESQTKLLSQTADRQRLAAQRDQLQSSNESLKTALDQWTAAVAARDEALKKADSQFQSLAEARNDAIAKFNDLANKYNTAVGEITKANDEIQQLAKERSDLVARYNELAAKYNAVVPPPSAATRP